MTGLNLELCITLIGLVCTFYTALVSTSLIFAMNVYGTKGKIVCKQKWTLFCSCSCSYCVSQIDVSNTTLRFESIS